MLNFLHTSLVSKFNGSFSSYDILNCPLYGSALEDEDEDEDDELELMETSSVISC